MRLVTRLMRLLKNMSGCRRQGCVDPVSLVCTFKRFQRSVEKYNKIYRVQLPKITPHVCRHTFCTNMAKRGISVETLKYLMGHTDISVTLNVYTHLKLEDAEKEIKRLENVEKELKKCAR